MNIGEALEAEHSKAQTIRIAGFVGDSKSRFRELAGFVLGSEPVLAQRAAWAVTQCAEEFPHLVFPHLQKLLENLRRKDLLDGVKRNTMKVAAELEIPDEYAGLAADVAFELLASPGEAVAVKVHSMSVLEQLCLREPALVEEFRMTLDELAPVEKKPVFRSKLRHVRKTLAKLE